MPLATARSMMADAFGAAVVMDGVDVYSVAHLGRSPTAHQRTALEARGYRCEVPGCASTTALEIDHIAEWTKTYRTRVQDLCWLCRLHHHDKTHRGFRLEGPVGNRRWLAPGAEPAGHDPPGDPPAAGHPGDPETGRPRGEPASGQPPEAATLFGDPSAA